MNEKQTDLMNYTIAVNEKRNINIHLHIFTQTERENEIDKRDKAKMD